uniref:Uncharacterized protein n=1 Tax=Physcomitrium patens TaxID=3218 RepID=A0A7I4CP87_PHYPA
MQGIESPGVGVFKYSTTSSMGAAFSLLHVHSSASSWGIPMPPFCRGERRSFEDSMLGADVLRVRAPDLFAG